MQNTLCIYCGVAFVKYFIISVGRVKKVLYFYQVQVDM